MSNVNHKEIHHGKIPGPKARAIMNRGIPLFQNGLIFQDKVQQASRRGFRSAGQIMIDRAHGDFIWDVDGNKYIDCLDDEPMHQLHGHAITYRIELVPQQGRKVFTLQTVLSTYPIICNSIDKLTVQPQLFRSKPLSLLRAVTEKPSSYI